MPIFLLALIDKGRRAKLTKAERNALAGMLPKIADAYRQAAKDGKDDEMLTFGQDLLESAAEALANARAEKTAARTMTVEVIDVVAIRKRLGLSQEAFANRFGLSAATLRDWEQGRRRMDRTARALLKVIDHAPDTVDQALRVA